MVKFAHVYDRDTLVLDSPHIFGNVSVSFVKHNEARNCHRLQFDQHCWLLLLGFPNDYHSERHIQNAISKFAKVLLWEASEAHMNRLLVRARVNDLQKVPQFIVYSNPDTLNGDSWTIQCELLLHHPNEPHLRKIKFHRKLTLKMECLLISSDWVSKSMETVIK